MYFFFGLMPRFFRKLSTRNFSHIFSSNIKRIENLFCFEENKASFGTFETFLTT